MHKIIIFIAFLLNSLNTSAQIKFVRTIGGGDNIYGSYFCLCHDSGYAVCGGSVFGIHVIRFDKYGDTLWTRLVKNSILTGINASSPSFIIETENHGLAVTSGEDESARYFLLDSTGAFIKEKVWIGKQYLGSYFELPGVGYVISQRGTDCCPSDPYGTYFKMDTSDNMILYQRLYNGNSGVHSFIKAKDGGYVTVGTSDVTDSSFITKYEGSGGAWKTFVDARPLTVISLSNSNYLINAYWKDSLMNYHYGIILTDSLGNTIWKKDVARAYNAIMAEVTTPGLEGYALLLQDGKPNSNWENNKKFFKLIKTDLSGNVLWIKHFEGEFSENANALISLKDGGFAICGTTTNYGPFTKLFFMKTDSNGNTQ